MKRIITEELIVWKNSQFRKPLILRGARQVGKSYSVVDFGKTNFKGKTHIVNLEQNPDWHKIFDKNIDVQRIKSELEILLNERISIDDDLLFIDEIQECPKAILALRYFYEQMPALHIIAAGSLLEFALSDISFPVGRVQLLSMHPMNFYEFLLAVNKNIAAYEITKKPTQLPESVHNLLMNELRNYFFVGGMPQCVLTYSQTGSITEVGKLQSDLLNTFRQDFAKYAEHSDKRCLNSVLNNILQKIGQQIKYTTLDDSFTSPTIKKAFNLLETARLFKKVHATSAAGIPLLASASEKIFKAIFLDVGLLARISGIPISSEYNKNTLLAMFKGALAEQFIGQEIIAAGNENLFYWSRQAKSSNAEVDYLIEKQDKIIPIEVKSGAAGSLKSLHLLLQTYSNIDKAYIFSDAQFGELPEHKLVFLPLYFAGNIVKNM